MFRNYLKIAWRNLMKYKFISFINIFGLTVGLTCCLLILTYIIHELSYDKYNNNSENIYRVTRIFNNPETKAVSLHLGTVAPPFGPLLKNDFKQIQKMTVLLPNGNIAFRYEDKLFYENDCYFADEYLFDVFKVDVVKGNPKTALVDPYSVMLKEDIAKKYFGNEDPINKMIRLDNQLNCKVTGVYKAFPSNSHVHPSIMISFNTLKDTTVYGEENLRTNWGNNSFLTYMVLPENTNIKSLESQFPAFINRHMPKGDGNSRFKQSDGTSLTLQKLTDIHLRSHLDYEAEENGDIKRVYIFSAIALFILLIACINYMNLSTARSTLRAREIGVRKVVGAQRKELISQFLIESILISFVAIILAFALTALFLPWLNQASGQNLTIQMLLKWQILLPLAIVPFVIGTVSGIYPAIFLSSFRPVMVLKGLFKAGGANISFRQVLVTAQFAISIILIVSTAIVFKQLKYMQNTNLGFDRDHIITMPYSNGLNNTYEAFRNELLSNSNFKNVGRSSRIPTGRLLDAMGSRVRRGDTLAPATLDIKFVAADKDFINTYGVKVLAGRGFSGVYSTDSTSFMINDAAARLLGFKQNQDAVGQQFGYGGTNGELIGVFNDFHFESMHQKIVALVLIPSRGGFFGRISVKISGTDIPGALAHLEKTWKKFQPEIPYSYTFMDENFERIYQSEQRQGSIFTIFAFIAIFIACLGLLGLSAFAISQRLKEIGIRKVLGASTGSIVGLLSKDFLKLVILAAIIAFPVAWYAMRSWLNDFAYRINIPWWIFLLAGIVAAGIALLTVSLQAVRAATANPVKSLRTE